jgi:hypothetical protein
MKKRYKIKEYHYRRYSIDFPSTLNEKIEPFMHKKFNVDLTIKDTPEQEIINITLMRKSLLSNFKIKKLPATNSNFPFSPAEIVWTKIFIPIPEKNNPIRLSKKSL